jgi:hypothetical protein
MPRIESLTPEQEARMAEYAARGTEVACCTDPADRPRAEAAIRDMYLQGGLKPPGKIVWCGSPLSMAVTRSTICGQWIDVWEDRVGDSVKDSVRASIRESVSSSARKRADSVRDSVRNSVRARVESRVRPSVESSIWDSAGNGVTARVRNSVRESVRNLVWDSLWRRGYRGSTWIGDRDRDVASVYGSHDASWLAFYRYFHDVLGLTDQTGELSGLWELAESAGWAMPRTKICWVSERHNVLKRDDRGRLHSLSGPACAWPDGWSIHAVHGVCVPPDVVEQPSRISVGRIDDQFNAEVRRVMIERYRHGEEISGWAAYFIDAGGEILDHDERCGTLWRRNVPYHEPIVMVEVMNATPEPDGSRKRYWLRVPPQMTTAREAVAWTFGLSEGSEYAPVKET